VRDVVQPAVACVVLVLLWEGAVRIFAIPVYLLPAPSAIWTETTRIAGAVGGHTLATLRTILIGFAVSIAVSLPLAIVITYSPLFANSIYPLLVLTQSIPKVALAPILVIALGTNELPRVAVTFLVAFFPLVIAVAAGLLAVPSELIELGRSYRASRLQELYGIRLPYAVPFIFSGLKVAITLSVVGAVVGEFVAANQGLGYLITSSTAFFKTPVAFGAMVLLSLMGIVLFQAVVIVERVFFPWSSGAGANTPVT
jgi:NitT/TauT family transport system permease protein